ncbi:MAG TPA: hypothetical protein VGK67_27210 [Myxococcales bacterium]|jgi:hypothetical protein
MERTLRTRILLLAVATLLGVASSCTGWLLDWTGTQCGGNGECGGTLECVNGTCQERGTQPETDGSVVEDKDGSASAMDARELAGDTGAVTAEDTGGVGVPDGGPITGEDTGVGPGADAALPAQDAGLPGLDATAAGLDAAAIPTSIHNCGDASVCYHQLDGEPLAVSVVSETDVWVVGKNGMAQHWDGTGWKAVDVVGPWDGGSKDAAIDTLTVVRAVPGYVMVASDQQKRIFEKRASAGPAFQVAHVADYPIHGGWVGSDQEALVAESNCEAAKLNGTTWTDNAGGYISGLSAHAVDGPDLGHLTMVGNSGLVVRFEPDFNKVSAKRGTNGIGDYFKSVKVFGDVRYIAGTDMNGAFNKMYVLKCRTSNADAGALWLDCVDLVTTRAAAAVWGRADNDVWIAGVGGYLAYTDGTTVTPVASGKVFDDMIAIDGVPSLVVAVGAKGAVMTYVPPP